MNGMGGGALKVRNQAVTAHFLATLQWQLLVALVFAIVAAVVAAVVLRRHPLPATTTSEPTARRILRIGFGVLWVVDGLLQIQPAMPIGLPTQVVEPTIASAPGIVVHAVTLSVDAWLRHPTVGAVATVWLQIGLGAWLLASREGWLSRTAGWASAGWALAIWVVGNGVGGLFVPPITWFFGAPGATFFYLLAGVAIGLPPAWLHSRRLLAWASRGLGALFVWLGIVQALPNRGFWSGGTAAHPGALAGMAQQMAQLSQPAATAAMERWFAAAALHVGPVLNAVAVVVLLGLGVSLLLGRRSLLVPAAVGYSAVALLAWVLVQDLGVFGGVGTDVNSMVPSVLVVVSLVVALRQAPATAVATVPDEQAQVVRRTRAMLGSAAAAIFALGAVGMLVLPILPGASADAAVAAGSGVASLSGVAPGFTLTDQHGRTVTLASLKGRTVVLAFLDPVCTSDCPIEAQELKAAAAALGPDAKVTFVAINANPTYRSIAALQAFDEREGLADESRWLYLTGSTAALQAAWNAYGVVVTSPGAGSMVSHAEPIFVIRPDGRLFSTWTAAVGDGGGSVLGRSTTSLVIAQVQAAS